MTDTASATPEARLQTFRQRRNESVVQKRGNLALTTTQLIDSEQQVWGVPGTWAPLAGGESGVMLTAAAADGIRVDGELVDGTVVVRGAGASEPSTLVFSDTVDGTVVSVEGGSALRVWDTESDAIREFGTIDAFDYNPDWVVSARFTEKPEGTTVSLEHLKDEGSREVAVPGEVIFEKDGTEYSLVAMKSGRALQIVFADATSGDSTYSVGRFLFVAPNPDGTVTLDFNYAVLPPCAFSFAFNCPMPPKQNRFTVPIEAGEKNVLKKDGSVLHG